MKNHKHKQRHLVIKVKRETSLVLLQVFMIKKDHSQSAFKFLTHKILNNFKMTRLMRTHVMFSIYYLLLKCFRLT